MVFKRSSLLDVGVDRCARWQAVTEYVKATARRAIQSIGAGQILAVLGMSRVAPEAHLAVLGQELGARLARLVPIKRSSINMRNFR
ncbi:hypothetical protein Q9R32_02960 [Actinotalea sp. AC32]|nr:hypothetical protein [Actinotalea sp. AC32]